MTTADAAQPYPKLNALQPEAVEAAKTKPALYERAEALIQQAP